MRREVEDLECPKKTDTQNRVKRFQSGNFQGIALRTEQHEWSDEARGESCDTALGLLISRVTCSLSDAV